LATSKILLFGIVLIIGSLGYAFAQTPPSVVLSSSASDPTNTSPIPMTATFSEPVTGFTIGAITVGNGVASNFLGSGTTYTFDVTPTADGLVTVDVAAAAAQDAAGNGNTAATQFTCGRIYCQVLKRYSVSI